MRESICISPHAKKSSACAKLSAACDGVDESRTRVRKPVHRPSTIIVYSLRFPRQPGNRHPDCFGSFMIRPRAQSFARVVSRMIDARVSACGCTESDSRGLFRLQRADNYCQRLYLGWDLTHRPADSFSGFTAPVETFTTPCNNQYNHFPRIGQPRRECRQCSCTETHPERRRQRLYSLKARSMSRFASFFAMSALLS